MIPLVLLLLGCGFTGSEAAYTGTIEVTEVDIAALVPGRLIQVDVREGDRVAIGQLIFALDATQLEAQVDLRNGQVAQAQAAIEAARAQVRAADAQVTFLSREARRVRRMEADGVGTDQQASTLEGQLSVARAQAAAARELVAQAEAALTQGEAGLHLAQVQLDEATVEAPVGGIVLSRNREPGEIVAPGMSVLTLGDLDHPRLRVYVPLERVEEMALGDPVQVVLDVDRDNPLQGKISWISSEAEFTPRDILTPDERVKRVYALDVALPPTRGVHPGVPAEAIFGEG